MSRYAIAGATGFALWGLLHIAGGAAILIAALQSPAAGYASYATADGPYDALSGAILSYFAYGLICLGAIALVTAWRGNRLNSEPALILNTAMIVLVELGLIAFLLIPGHVTLVQASIGFVLAAIGIVFGGMACAGKGHPMPLDEPALLRAAQLGDRRAFDRLAADAMPRLTALLRRQIGHPDDCADVAQEALTAAWQNLGRFRAESAFATWLLAIAARKATDHLRQKQRWRKEAQVAYANLCAQSQDLSGEIMQVASDPEFAFDVREHIAHCFACVGRSLPPDDQAALVLRDVVGLSAREAATALGISDAVLRHRLAAARQAMTDSYDGLCALVNKQGICHQCKGLAMLAPEGRRGGPTPDIDDFAHRCAVVREAPPRGGMAALHDVFWRRTAEIEAAGTGTVTPDTDCGQDDT